MVIVRSEIQHGLIERAGNDEYGRILLPVGLYSVNISQDIVITLVGLQISCKSLEYLEQIFSSIMKALQEHQNEYKNLFYFNQTSMNCSIGIIIPKLFIK